MKKKNRKMKYKPPKTERQVVYPTANAKRIGELMKSHKIKGKYKDHVVIVGARMIDWLGTYDIVLETDDGVKRYGVEGMAIVHKRKLAPIVGAALAKKFWHCGMRTNYGVESRRVGCK